MSDQATTADVASIGRGAALILGAVGGLLGIGVFGVEVAWTDPVEGEPAQLRADAHETRLDALEARLDALTLHARTVEQEGDATRSLLRDYRTVQQSHTRRLDTLYVNQLVLCRTVGADCTTGAPR